MAFQFAHVETYSRKGTAKGGGSVGWVLAEAKRDKGACPHVAQPGEPKQVYGCTLDELEALHDELCATVRYEVAGGKTRAIRQDQHTLFTVVCSYPVPMDEVHKSPDETRRLEEWMGRNLEWLKSEYGDDLKSIVLHDDEQFPHIHAYVLPDDLRCRNLHAGVAAKEAVMKSAPEPDEDSKAHNKRGDKEYRAAMSAWQDRYFDQVGLSSGLTRLGPGKRRLSREEWKAEQTAVKSVQIAQERVRDIEVIGSAYVTKTKQDAALYVEKTRAKAQSEADAIKADAIAKTEDSKRLHSAAIAKEKAAAALVRQAGKVTANANLLDQRARKMHIEAHKIMQKAQSEANRILNVAKAQAQKIASFGSGLRSLWSGLKVDKIRDKIKNEASDEINKLDSQRREAVMSMYQERRKRQDAEKRISESMAYEKEARTELYEARLKLESLSKSKPSAGRQLKMK